MFNIFKKSPENDDIVVVKRTDPHACGGTNATQNTKAPKEIVSEEMILFNAASALSRGMMNMESAVKPEELLSYISAFAVPAKEGVFLFLDKKTVADRYQNKPPVWALVRNSIFPSLVQIVKECDLAKGNGYHSFTNGLPQNFGGSVDIRYASGETIRFSNNQCPVLSVEAAGRIADVFETAMQGERIALPDIAALQEIHFCENCPDGGYTKAVLTLHPDGTGTNAKSQRFDTPDIYEGETSVDAETIANIKNTIAATGILAWTGIPDNDYKGKEDKTLTFVFDNHEPITVRSKRLLPFCILNGFFNIELEITTKH